MNSFKQKCITLRKQDKSLLEIAKITGRPKTSVYFHIRDIPLSSSKLKKVYELNLQHLTRVAESRRGKSVRGFRTFDTWNTKKVSLVAHLLFDGEIKRYGCFYNNRNKTLLKKVESCMKEVYYFPPSRYFNTLTGVSRISYHNVALGPYIKQKSKQLLEEVIQLPKDLKREFLVAFFDDEGCMDFRPGINARRIRGYQKDTSILKLITTLLSDFEIKSRFQKPNEVVISGKENLLKFQKEINFSPGVYINGNRTNSLWKKHLEKRELLDRAISSFKS